MVRRLIQYLARPGAWSFVLLGFYLSTAAYADNPSSPKPKCARFLTVHDFKNINRNFSLINRYANRGFRARTRGPSTVPQLYFHIENTVLKELNDEVFQDKTLNHAITNYFMAALYGQVLNHPFLQYYLQGRYADYKGLRLVFGLKEIDPANPHTEIPFILPPNLTFKDLSEENIWAEEITRLLQMITAQTRQTFTAFLGSFDYFIKNKKQAKAFERLPAPEAWFMPGTGSTLAEAAASARLARDYAPEGTIMTFENAREILDLILGSAEQARLQLTTKFKDAPFVQEVERANEATGTTEKMRVLSPDFLATFRLLQKRKGNLAAAFRKEVRLKWNTDFGREDLEVLEAYLKNVRYFSPPIYQEATVAFDFRKAHTGGALGLDLAQIGALATAKLMASIAGLESTDQALLAAAATSKEMANHIKQQHNIFKKFWRKFWPLTSSAVEISGDDLVIYPPKKITDGQINAYLRYLTTFKNSWAFRTVFLRQINFQDSGAEISEEDISAILVGAEDLQKALMRELVPLLPPEALRQSAMVIEVLPFNADLNTYRLIIALPQTYLQEFREALETIQSSDEWLQEYGPGSKYRYSFMLRYLPAKKVASKNDATKVNQGSSRSMPGIGTEKEKEKEKDQEQSQNKNKS